MVVNIIQSYREMDSALTSIEGILEALELSFDMLTQEEQLECAERYTSKHASLDLRAKLLRSQLEEARNWLRRLPDVQLAEAIQLHYIEGLCWPETADIMGVSAKAIARRVQRYLKKEQEAAHP